MYVLFTFFFKASSKEDMGTGGKCSVVQQNILARVVISVCWRICKFIKKKKKERKIYRILYPGVMETLNANFDFQVMLCKSCEGKFDNLPIMIYFNAYAMHHGRSPMLIPYSRVFFFILKSWLVFKHNSPKEVNISRELYSEDGI